MVDSDFGFTDNCLLRKRDLHKYHKHRHSLFKHEVVLSSTVVYIILTSIFFSFIYCMYVYISPTLKCWCIFVTVFFFAQSILQNGTVQPLGYFILIGTKFLCTLVMETRILFRQRWWNYGLWLLLRYWRLWYWLTIVLEAAGAGAQLGEICTVVHTRGVGVTWD